ncbi:MAG: permease [Chloroflexota bacterium]
MPVVTKALQDVWVTFTHSWPLLLISAAVATALRLYVDQKKVSAFLRRHERAGIVGATAVAVTTPLCACGTMAVVLGMMASFVSWAPIVAFMVASPLSSPQELFYSAGLFGWRFAWFHFAASIALGLLGGLVASVAERRGWLRNQLRFQSEVAATAETGRKSCGCGDAIPATPTCACDAAPAAVPAWAPEFARQTARLLAMFLGFAFVGYLLNGLIPPGLVGRLFGSGRVYGVPLAAALGLPLYVNSEASLPLVRSFLDLGMSPGATLAFLLTGAGTSAGAIAGALTIAKARVIAIVIGTLWVGAIAAGYVYNALIAVGVF